MDGDWETAKDIIDFDQDAKTKEISPSGFTALHVAASFERSEFVVELVNLLTEQDLNIRDQRGRTALHHVALAASVEAAEAMVQKNPILPYLVDKDKKTPLLYAAQRGHQLQGKRMLEYLLQVTEDEPYFEAFTGDSGSNLIVAITAVGAYDIALRILHKHRELAYSKNAKGKSILHVLATRPSAFPSGNKLYQWMMHMGALKLVEFVCGELHKKSIAVIQEFFIPKDGTAILHLAIEHGVLKLVHTCLRNFPDLIWYPNNKKRLLLHAAVEHRQAKIFNYLIALIRDNTKMYAEFKEDEDNNSLHLAAKLAPSSRLQSILGPAFQMQRELQWFEAVKALVYEETMTEKNKTGQTPQELFSQHHANLQKDAKDWIKDISNSYMVVAALIATVAFAAMITVPGGNDNETGIPILSKKNFFIAFTISNALSMISSVISLLMFLSLQTSSYAAEEDFLDRIPKFLCNGLSFLLLAVATMMISFATGFGLSLQKKIFNWAYIPIMVVACCPAIIFYNLQVPLLLQTLLFTSVPGNARGQRGWKCWGLSKFDYRLLADDEP